MKEQVVSFETAKMAKEVGFDVPTVFHYEGDGNELFETFYGEFNTECVCNLESLLVNCNNEKEISLYSAPTQSLLQKWLREKFKIHINIGFNGGWYYVLYEVNAIARPAANKVYLPTPLKSYEETLERGLQEALKIVKQ